jgi:hypothetical protein
MRLDIEGKHTPLAPHLVGWIAERLEALNTPYGDICERGSPLSNKDGARPSAWSSCSPGRASR